MAENLNDLLASAEKKSAQAGWLALLGLGVMLAAVVYTYAELSNLRKAVTTTTKQLAAIQQTKSIAQDQLDSLQKELTETTKFLEQARAQKSAILKFADSIPSTAPRNVRIIYYPKNQDQDRVAKALEALGFTIDRGKPKVENPTNTLFFGSEVPPEDIKLVALTLIKAHVELRGIRPIRNDVSKKAKVIEIGFSAKAEGNPVLTLDYIASAETFS